MSTIVAVSTAPVNAGIGIIRMSGDNCFEILGKIFIPKNKQDIEEIPGYSIKYGYIIEVETNEKIDEVLVSIFKKPKSYTTENMCEINSHGGMVVVEKILKQCLVAGAELAEPGEFTKRAFLNGRIDLSQAEGIIDLINAKSGKEAKASFNQLEGGLSKRIQDIRKPILNILSDIEASIDYPEYDEVPEITNTKMLKEMDFILDRLLVLDKSFENGKILKEGINTVIIGKPNTGKSSLLNALLNEERAIVSSVKGTTRDTIEEMIQINGIPLKIVDTAGIRNTDDEVEKIGVDKALKLSKKADLIIALVDITQELEEEDIQILNLIKDKKTIILLNKIDKNSNCAKTEEMIKNTGKIFIKISAQNKDGLDDLYKKIIELFNLNELDLSDSNFITNVRHKNHIRKAIESINEAKNGINLNYTVDVIGIYIKQALEELSSITGENVSEDIINEIFSKFCLGK